MGGSGACSCANSSASRMPRSGAQSGRAKAPRDLAIVLKRFARSTCPISSGLDAATGTLDDPVALRTSAIASLRAARATFVVPLGGLLSAAQENR